MNIELEDVSRPAPATIQQQVTLLTGNCVDRQQLAVSSAMLLDELNVLDASGVSVARFASSLWRTPDVATSWLRLEGDLCLGFGNGSQRTSHLRTYSTLELMGLTLWAPQRVMLAYFSQWTNRWVDRAGCEHTSITISPGPMLLELYPRPM